MDQPPSTSCAAFEGGTCIASGDLLEVAREVKTALEQKKGPSSVLIFDDFTGEPVEIDFRGSVDDVLRRLPQPETPPPPSEEPQEAPRGPGRPKLGVVSREVTLLPRHWEWLNNQPGGASVTLRKLVEQARLAGKERQQARLAQEAAYRFMSAMCGDLPGFEEANRALFAGDGPKFQRQTEAWPQDLREFARKLARPAFTPQ